MENLTCPDCQKQVSLAQFLKSPSPWHIKCKNCHERLKAGKPSISVFTLLLVVTVAFGVLIVVTAKTYGISFIYYALTIILIGFGAEIALYFIFKKLRVELKSKQSSGP